MSRTYSIDVKAGCEQCGGSAVLWQAKNAHGVAAKHAQKTGHTTWVEVYAHHTYNAPESAGATK